MNTAVMRELIRLRYQLMWAKTRSRNGRIALFFAGYILLVVVIMLLAFGGFGAGYVAVRSGKGEIVARVVFGSVFFQALLASVILGFGMNSVFSETELRRYPVTARERRMVRHIIGMVDPFWFLFLLLDVGMVVGLYVVGGAPLGRGLVAVLLLIAVNYVLARIIAMAIDRMMELKTGAALVMLLILTFAFVPSIIAPYLKGAAFREAMLRVMSFTPPFGAAVSATHHDANGWSGIGLLAGWLVVLVVVLAWVERWPPVARRVESAIVSWDSWYDRLAGFFPREDAPFVAHWLRFYLRNNRFRIGYAISLPLVAFLIFNFARQGGGIKYFQAALGAFAIVGFIPTSRMSLNQYGYSSGGFRRYFLLPTDPAASLRAGAYACLMLGSILIPIAMLAWTAFVPLEFDIRKAFMLLGSAVTGLFLFHGIGLWVSLFNPRKGDYGGNFGNDMSLGGNIVLIGGMMTCIAGPQVLAKFAPAAIAPERWWTAIATSALAVAFFAVSLRAAAGMLQSRRERLLAIVEGKD